MVCYYPLSAFRSIPRSCDLKSDIVFGLLYCPDGYQPLTLPCGQCIGCRLEYSRNWAIRCIHEASLHESSCFVTLTYSDDHLPADGSLNLKHFQDFMKRLRKKFGAGIRFFHCGEYGALLERPHYHVLLYGIDFPDKKFWQMSRGKRSDRLYTSSILENLWGKGFAPIGSVSFESAAYVARYIMKKQRGKSSRYVRCSDGTLAVEKSSCYVDDYYQGKKPEYVTMSRRPGIASDWFAKFSSDVYPSDFVVVNGRKSRPPRYYDKLFEKLDPVVYDNVKLLREEALYEYELSAPGEFSIERLAVKEQCKLAQVATLTREF